MNLHSLELVDIKHEGETYTYVYAVLGRSFFFWKSYLKFTFKSRLAHYLWTEIQKVMLKEKSMPSTRRSSKKKEQESPCELVLCEDPKTGDLIVKPTGKCPVGYMEKIRDKALEEGITIIVPKIFSRDE